VSIICLVLLFVVWVSLIVNALSIRYVITETDSYSRDGILTKVEQSKTYIRADGSKYKITRPSYYAN